MYDELEAELTKDQEALREQAHRFAVEVLRPASLALDAMDPEEVIAEGSPYWNVVRSWYSQGNHGLGFAEEIGGAGLTPFEQHLVFEELGWGAADLAVSLGVSTFPFMLIERMAALVGANDLIDELVVPFIEDRSGGVIGCWAITEPMHGSDTLDVGDASFGDASVAGQCRARRDGGEWVIAGQKSAWVSNGTIATHACVYLTVDPSKGMAGGGVAVVPLDRPGVSRGKQWAKIGQRALPQGEIFFDDVRIPERYMIIGPELYPEAVEATLASANAGMGAIFTGLARAAFEEALEYTHDRVQGGKLISEHQLVQSKLFQMFVRVEQARALSRRAYIHSQTALLPMVEYSIASKVTGTEAAFEVANAAVQLCGAIGLSKGVLVEKLLRDARAALIEDGVNELLGLVAARRLVARPVG
jgi:alkylation response protein AidB-like acyl-CoA dehydrogenase